MWLESLATQNNVANDKFIRHSQIIKKLWGQFIAHHTLVHLHSVGPDQNAITIYCIHTLARETNNMSSCLHHTRSKCMKQIHVANVP